MADYTLSEASVKKLYRHVFALDHELTNIKNRIGPRIAAEVADYVAPPPKPIWCWNTDSSEAPPYGLLACHDATATNTLGRDVLKVQKPGSAAPKHFVNGDYLLGANDTYKAQHGPVFRLAYDTGSPVNGDMYGAKDGQWEASAGQPGYICLGVIDAVNRVMLAIEQTGFLEFRIQLANDVECDDEVAVIADEPIYPLGGASGTLSAAEPFDASNALGLVGDAGDWGIIIRQSVPGEPPWLLTQVRHKCAYVDTDQQVDGLYLQHKKQRGSFPSHDEEDWQTWHEGIDCEEE